MEKTIHKNNRYFIPHQKGSHEKYIKHPQDFICALLALIVLSPVLLIITILVRIKSGTPVLSKQRRPGLNGEIFTLHEFRTMTDKRDANGNLLPSEERLTPFRIQIRRLSIGELPEIWNTLSKTPSVVGPRPLLVSYLSLYNEQ